MGIFLTAFFDHCAIYLLSENTERNIAKLDQIKKINKLSKKAAVVSIFCLIGKIQHNFLVPRMIESGRQTFISIQTFDLHRVVSMSLWIENQFSNKNWAEQKPSSQSMTKMHS